MIYYHSLLSHGSGALRQVAFVLFGWIIRFSIGGYGNVPAPYGSWRRFPRITTQYGYFRIYWLNFGVSIFPPKRGHGVLCGFRRVI